MRRRRKRHGNPFSGLLWPYRRGQAARGALRVKKILLAAPAALTLSGCELAMLACGDDYDCDNDFANRAPHAGATH